MKERKSKLAAYTPRGKLRVVYTVLSEKYNFCVQDVMGAFKLKKSRAYEYIKSLEDLNLVYKTYQAGLTQYYRTRRKTNEVL